MQPSNVPEPLSQPKPEIASIKFTFAMAYELAHSSDPYPVDLEDVIAWGLSEAKTDRFARRYLKDLILETFTEGQDFMHDFSAEKHNNPVAHRPLRDSWLSSRDC